MAVACSPANEGRERWKLELLADKLVELKVVDSIDKETVRRTQKKRRCRTEGRGVGSLQATVWRACQCRSSGFRAVPQQPLPKRRAGQYEFR